MSDAASTPRRISHANAHRPPQNRRRVWRACESCRKKKVKCDGEDPCKPCSGYGIACSYPETARGSAREFPNGDMVSNRLRSLEEMVAKLAQVQSTQCERRSQSVALSSTTTQATAAAEPQALPVPAMIEPAMHVPTDDILNTTHTNTNTNTNSNTNNLDLLDDLLSTAIDPSFWPSAVPRPLPIQTYADCFGQLEVDPRGETRYVGLGASVCIVDNCAGLRKRIQSGLASKGFEPQESLLDSTPTSSPGLLAAPSPIGWWAGDLPPAALMDALVERYFARLHFLFPIVSEPDFRTYYEQKATAGAESLALLYAVLAVAASQIADPADAVYTLSDCWRYQGVDLGAHFFSLAVASMQAPAADVEDGMGRNAALHTVMARALLSVHLTQIGMPRKAWKMVSHAVRLGQDMGLHRSPCKFHLPETQQSSRRRVWWCLYVMDRLLSMNLGRPLAIEDADCDVEMPVPAEGITGGFIAMVRLCQIIGAVLRVSNSVGNAARWRDPANYPELRATVEEFRVQLERWGEEELRHSHSTVQLDSGDMQEVVEQNVLLSTHLSTLILLFRPLMSNPHRESPLGTEVAMRRCLEASTSCIRMTEGYLGLKHVSHYLIIHGQTVFICIILLMHCIRLTEDEAVLREAVEDCQRGIHALMQLEGTWGAAKQCKAIAEEYLEFTLDVLERGGRGRCSFDHGEGGYEQGTYSQAAHTGRKRVCERGTSGNMNKRLHMETGSRPCSFALRTATRR